jgi:hypothetical protein
LIKIQTEVKQKFLFLLQLMIIVDDAGSFIPAMNHSPWDGVTVADFVMPFFLFIVGVALALAYKVVHAGESEMPMSVSPFVSETANSDLYHSLIPNDCVTL